MSTINTEDIARQVLLARQKKKESLSIPQAVGGFVKGAVTEGVPAAARAIGGVIGMAGPGGLMPDVLARRSGEMLAGIGEATTEKPAGPTILPPGRDPSEALKPSPLPYEIGNQILLGVPGIVERGVAGTFGSLQDIQPNPDGGVTATPLPYTPEQRGAAFGTAAGELAPFWAPVPAAKAMSRFRPVRMGGGAAPIAPPGPPAGPEAAPSPAATPAAPAPTSTPPLLPAGPRGLTQTTVAEGFTPIRKTYKVWAATRPPDVAPGGAPKSPKGVDWGQYREIEAFSRDEALTKVQAEMDRTTPGASKAYIFKADPIQETARAIPAGAEEAAAKKKAAERVQYGMNKQAEAAAGTVGEKPIALGPGSDISHRQPKPPEPVAGQTEGLPEVPAKGGFKPLGDKWEVTVTPKGGHGEPTGAKTFTALTEKSAILQAKKAIGLDAEKYDYQATMKAEPPDEGGGGGGEPAVRTPRRPNGPAPTTAPGQVGGKSKMVREATPEEAPTVPPEGVKKVGPSHYAATISPEAERRIANRRGGEAGGGATSFGEERGPEAPERRASPGRRITDTEITDAATEGRRRLDEIAAAKTYEQLKAVYRKHHNADPPPKFGKQLRAEMTREAAAMVKGAKQALEGGKFGPPEGESDFQRGYRKSFDTIDDKRVQRVYERKFSKPRGELSREQMVDELVSAMKALDKGQKFGTKPKEKPAPKAGAAAEAAPARKKIGTPEERRRSAFLKKAIRAKDREDRQAVDAMTPAERSRIENLPAMTIHNVRRLYQQLTGERPHNSVPRPDLEMAIWEQTRHEALARTEEPTSKPGRGEQPPRQQAPKPPTEEAPRPTIKPHGSGVVLETGKVVQSARGRALSPAPKIDTTTERSTKATLRRVDEWLHSEALKEAENSDHLTTIVKGIDPKRMSPSDRETLNDILFDKQLTRPRPAPPKPPEKPKVGPIEVVNRGEPTKIKAQSQHFDAEYAEVPIEAVKTSHDPLNFNRNSEYPFRQQRAYETDVNEQMKVIEESRKWDPELYFTDNKTPETGPSMLSEEGWALGGNGRMMMLKRALHDGTIAPEQLQAWVKKNGAKFGIPNAGEKPGTVIVRLVKGDMGLGEMEKATGTLNQSSGGAIDPVAHAVSRAKAMTPETAAWVSERLSEAGPESTIRDDVLGKPAMMQELMKRLIEDGVFTKREQSSLVDANTGKPTDYGKTAIESALIAKVMPDPTMIRELRPQHRQMIFSALSEMTKLGSFSHEWKMLGNDIINAIEMRRRILGADLKPVESWDRKKTITPEEQFFEPGIIPDDFAQAMKGNKVALALYDWLKENEGKSTKLREALKVYNEKASSELLSSRGQESLFGAEEVPPHLPHEAFNEAFGTKLSAADFGTGDGIHYLHAGLSPAAIKMSLKALSEKARTVFGEWLTEKFSTEPRPGDTFREAMMRGERPQAGAKLLSQLAAMHKAWTKAFVLDHGTRDYPYFHEQVDQYRVGAGEGFTQASNRLAEVVHPIIYNENKMTGAFSKRSAPEINRDARQLNWLIYVSDMFGRSRDGLPTPASGFFKDVPQNVLTAILEGEMKKAMIEASPNVKKAHRNWIKLMEEHGKELQKRGVIKTVRDWTYAPNVFQSMPWEDLSKSVGAPRKVGEPTRAYVQRSLGHIRKNDPNMIRAGVQHIHQITMDNLASDFSHSVGKAWDYTKILDKKIEARAKEEGITVKEAEKKYGPRDFPLRDKNGNVIRLTAHRVGLPKHAWSEDALGGVEAAIQRTILEDPDIGLPLDTFSQIREYAANAKGARAVYVIPEPISAAAKQFVEPRSSFENLVSQFTRSSVIPTWKVATLGAVYAAYKTANLVGDAANIVVRVPSRTPFVEGAKIMMRTPGALKDILGSYQKGGASVKLARTDAVGGRQNVRAIAEIGQLKSHAELEPFFAPERSALRQKASVFRRAVMSGLDRFMVADAIAEGVMRHAAIDYMIEKGLPAKRAERFASYLVGDYRAVDPVTSVMRRTALAPFAVWFRQMVPGWIRFTTGMSLGKRFEGPGGTAVVPPNVPRPAFNPPKGTDPALWQMAHSGAYPKAGAKLLAAAVSGQLLLWYWNSVVNKELDDKVPDSIKMKHTYVINPYWKTSDGRPILPVDVAMPWDAMTNFFGVTNVPERVNRYLEAKEAAKNGDPGALSQYLVDQLNESRMAPIDATVSQLGPAFRLTSAVLDWQKSMYWENQKPPEKQNVAKVHERLQKRIVRETVPFSRLVPGVQKPKDFTGAPEWTPYLVKGTPWGLVTLVPPMKSRKLGPGVSAMKPTVKPMATLGTGQ